MMNTDLQVIMYNPNDKYGLSSRERQVLSALADGFSQKQIGQILYIATNTVNSHIQKIYQKLNVHSAPGAVAKAIREGVIVWVTK